MAKRRKKSGTADYNAKLEDEVVGRIWTLTEEGRSQRQVAELLEIAPSTVHRELAADPIRLEAIRARQREARAAGWKKLEDLGLEEAVGWLELSRALRLRKGKLTKRMAEDIAVMPRFIQVTRHVAIDATKAVQLLTGGVTERIGGARGEQSDQELTAEQLIAMAIELDAIDALPPALKAAAEREKARRRTNDDDGPAYDPAPPQPDPKGGRAPSGGVSARPARD